MEKINTTNSSQLSTFATTTISYTTQKNPQINAALPTTHHAYYREHPKHHK
jgi:hypothetical protein